MIEALKAPLRELGEIEEIEKALRPGTKKTLAFSGCTDSQRLHLMSGLSENYKKRLIITYSEARMREICEEYRFYDKSVIAYPSKDLIFFQADIHGNQLVQDRIKVLRRLFSDEEVTVVACLDALMTPLVPAEEFRKRIFSIRKGGIVEEEALCMLLVNLGYQKNYQVQEPGQFSVHGGIVDVFDLTEENPIRIELWGDEVESLRSFDVTSQRSVEELEEITVWPATEMLLSGAVRDRGMHLIETDGKKQEEVLRKQGKNEAAGRLKIGLQQLRDDVLEFEAKVNLESYIRYFYDKTETLLDLFDPKETCILIDEPARICEHGSAVQEEFVQSMSMRLEKGYVVPGQVDILCGTEQTIAKMGAYSTATFASLDRKNLFKADKKYDFNVQNVSSYNGSYDTLVQDLRKYKKDGYRVFLLSGSRKRGSRIADDLRTYGISAFYSDETDRAVKPGEVMVYYGRTMKGFCYPLLKFVVLTESDIFGAEKKRRKRQRFSSGSHISSFDDLQVGDYVVHIAHGLGIYQGIEKIEMDHVVKDYMKISYRDGGNLYVPATNLDAIQKYASADSKPPKLNKLGSAEWEKTRTKTKAAVETVAKDLVALYAARQQKLGYEFGPDTVWQQEFEELFPFEETEDQIDAIAATKADMESTKIMDRLICGDVGYGKTEIAIRAAFKAVQESKQVAFLVPTTILAQQHYNTFVQRMKDFPVTIELLSRFRTPAEQRKTIQRLKDGQVDIVIGTHRLLSKDIGFKDLGLLIVDEEQRFGVSHKEKIKKLRDIVDVLTLTATPIPRTLHMSLIGIRDMSVLEEAPQDRMPVQTFVCEYNEEMVREAITRELGRNGQVYYLYNKVSTIADIAAKIQTLVPDAEVAFAHGQMKEAELEHIMYDFINGDIDVLVSTTIIETGLDIPNTNTIIIHDSNTMGLSQLYQLRGRVGRSNRNAYAFLMYQRDKMLTETAEKRLQAIREFTELGSGFKISMRDLEIRGTGNLLGKEQHGHMAAVGYDLYCKMLNDAVRTLKGESVEEDFATLAELEVDAYIPPDYIVNESQKLDIYKRIAAITTQAEFDEMREELLDRFGCIPPQVDKLLRVVLIRMRAHKLCVTEIKGRFEEIRFIMKRDADVRVEGIPGLLEEKFPVSGMPVHRSSLSMQPKGTPYFSMRYRKTGIVEKDEERLLQLAEDILSAMEKHLAKEE